MTDWQRRVDQAPEPALPLIGMSTPSALVRGSLVIVILMVCAGVPLVAQSPAFEVAYGWWFPSGDSATAVFHAGVHQQVWGRLGYGLDFVHVSGGDSAGSRTLSGGELSLRYGLDGSGPYALASAGLGARHHGGGVDAFWTIGGGLATRVFSALSVGIEVRYRAEDQHVTGFWNLDSTDLKGIQVAGRVAFAIPGLHRAAPEPTRGPDSVPPPPPPTADEAYRAAMAGGASEEAARVSASVVETALAVMGAPYQWGGTDANGFDCSGLIQYAYGQHGIVLPRISRDQARMGTAVDRRVEALRPGDVLAFSGDGTSGVTHVGLFVGDGQFLHSASGGVTLSSLMASDGDSRWWQQHWVAARRIVE
jgi:cell wall-associated NlpC family hydrolase